MTLPKKCLCGKDMHMSADQKVMVKQWGKGWPEFKKVIYKKKTYKVPTYYILLHGLKYDNFESCGFKEWSIA